jgi:hypothetical protein
MKSITIALLAAVTVFADSRPSEAQYYPYPPPPRPYYQPNPYDDGGYYRRQRPVVIGDICITSRGSCRTRPRPENSSCGCDIPGFGPKRGAVVARPGW